MGPLTTLITTVVKSGNVRDPAIARVVERHISGSEVPPHHIRPRCTERGKQFPPSRTFLAMLLSPNPFGIRSGQALTTGVPVVLHYAAETGRAQRRTYEPAALTAELWALASIIVTYSGFAGKREKPEKSTRPRDIWFSVVLDRYIVRSTLCYNIDSVEHSPRLASCACSCSWEERRKERGGQASQSATSAVADSAVSSSSIVNTGAVPSAKHPVLSARQSSRRRPEREQRATAVSRGHSVESRERFLRPRHFCAQGAVEFLEGAFNGE